jgi:hypothetical protein
MKQSRKTIALLAAVLILVILLLFANRNITRQSPQAAGGTVNSVTSSSAAIPTATTASLHDLRITATYIASLPMFPTIAKPPATPIPPTAIILPTATSDLQPPQCTFPLAGTMAEESKPEEYAFSEPQVMLDAIQGNYYNIVGWLPDNQQVLMTQDLYDISKSEGDKILRQSIELYNPETNTSQTYAIRHYIDESPIWQPKLNAVVYPAMNVMGVDENTHNIKFTRQVWASYGNPDTAQVLADNLAQFPIAINPDSNEVVYLSDKQIFKRDALLNKSLSTPFDPTQWDYRQINSNEHPISYEMNWQPGTELIFLHSNGGMQEGGGYTFILDTHTGEACELNLGGWAVKAHWSSDGRYLAIIRAVISSNPVDLTDLAILDTVTGKLYTTMVIPQETEGKHYVEDFVWAPDNNHLLVLGSIPSQMAAQGASVHHELYLADFASGQSIHLFPEFKSFFADGAPKNNFAWSSDGSKLLIRCPTNIIDRICLISVQGTRQ